MTRFRGVDLGGALLLSAVVAMGSLTAACSVKTIPGAAQGQAPSAGQPAAQGQPGGQGAGQYGGQGGGQGQNGGQGGTRRQVIIPVQAMTVQVGLLSAERTTAGVVTPVMQSLVAVQVGGIVSKVVRQAGDWVNQGAVVIQLDDSQLKLALANAQTALDTARINLSTNEDSVDQANTRLELQVQAAQAALDSAHKTYDGQKALFDLGGISAAALDTASGNVQSAQANLETAKTALDLNKKGLSTTASQNIEALKLAVTTAQTNLQIAQLNLQNATIRAPFAGQISAISVYPGMYVGQNSASFTLVSAQRQINFNISPGDTAALPAGAPLVFNLGAKAYPVRVGQTPSAPVNGLVPMVAAVPASFDLPYGAVGSIAYTVPLATGALVPITSLDTLENQNFVFAIENGRAVVHNVTILAQSGVTTAVSGVPAGAVIIISPPPGLIAGSQVQPTVVQGAAAGGGAAGQAAGQPQPGAATGQGRRTGGQGTPGSGGQGGSGAAGASGAAGQGGYGGGTGGYGSGSGGYGSGTGGQGRRGGGAPGTTTPAGGTPGSAAPAGTAAPAGAAPPSSGTQAVTP